MNKRDVSRSFKGQNEKVEVIPDLCPIIQEKPSKAVKKGKNEALKLRLRAIITSQGMTEPDFCQKIQMSKQQWYALSWGIWPAPDGTKIKIAKALNTDTLAIWRGEK